MEETTHRYFLHISFDGYAYKGWQIQPGVKTVQKTIEEAFSTILRREITITGAGRTDTGVHAKNYTAHVDLDFEKESSKVGQLVYKLNRILPPDIAIHGLERVNPEAHARFSALSRSYEYIICKKKNPFLINRAWRVEKELNVTLMQKITEKLTEFIDFQSFSKVNTQVSHYRCNIMKAGWYEAKDMLIFHITADRFLRNMVRAMVGTLVEAGLGKTSLEEFTEIVVSKNRSNAGYSAPGFGLYFMGAEYPSDIYPIE